MMFKTLLKGSTASKKLLTLIAIMGLGSMQVMADTSIVGPEDNLNNGYYDGGYKKNYTLEPGKTIKIEFTVSTATDDQLEGDVWNSWYAWAVNFWDGTLNAITIEPRNYGWEANVEGTNRWTENWAKYWEINYPEDWESGYNFRDNMLQGATVVTTIKRVGADVIIIYDITTTSHAKYRQYVVKTYGDGTQTIWFDLIVDHSHITIDNDKTVTTDTESVTGTLIGNLNRCAGFTTAESKKENFVIAPEGTLNLNFRNFSAGIFTWQSWMFEMLYNGKYCNMVAGNLNQWGELKSANGTFTNTNWPATDAEILEKMEGALVDLTIQRSGASVTVTAVHTPVSGDPFTLNYEFSSNEDGFATSDAEFHLISDYGYLDLLPAPATKYNLTLADGTDDAANWTISPASTAEGKTVTIKYNGTKKVKSVKAVKKAAAPVYTLLSATTAEDYGKVVCAAGHLHDAKTAVPAGCTAVGILGKVTETGHGLILALKNATSQTWNTINGWASASYAGTTLKVLPDDAARGTNLTSYTTLGETAVSNWAVAQKSDYETIFTNLGSTRNSGGMTYDNNVNAYITTGVGGTAMSGSYWSATQDDDYDAWNFSASYWYDDYNTSTYYVRPVLGF